jgi:hypothetical protein
MDVKDFESSLYWAKRIDWRKFKDLKCDRNFIICISLFKLNKRAYKKFHIYLNHCEPVKYRMATDIIENKGQDNP